MSKSTWCQVFGSKNLYPFNLDQVKLNPEFVAYLLEEREKRKEKEKMTKIYTSRLHPDCAALNSFLVENNIEFDWVENDDAEKFRTEVLKRKIKPILPCIIEPAEMCDESDTIYQGDVSKWIEKRINKI